MRDLFEHLLRWAGLFARVHLAIQGCVPTTNKFISTQTKLGSHPLPLEIRTAPHSSRQQAALAAAVLTTAHASCCVVAGPLDYSPPPLLLPPAKESELPHEKTTWLRTKRWHSAPVKAASERQ